jgi:hypothetical protein
MFEFRAKPKPVANSGPFRIKAQNQNLSSNPLLMEKQYIKEQEDKIKTEFLSRHLEAFKNKKHVSPFDIKIDPKFRIPANLSFFLVDQSVQSVKKEDAKIQTDKFRLRNPNANDNPGKSGNKVDQNGATKNPLQSQQTFVVRKTGKDQGVQVDTKKIFDFDREVAPIVTVIVTKTLEQSLWEVEQELELDNMKDKKENYYDQNDQAGKAKYRQFVEKEMAQLNEKYALIHQLTESNKTKATHQLQNFYDNLASNTKELTETPAEKYLKAFQKPPMNELQLFLHNEMRNDLAVKCESLCDHHNKVDVQVSGVLSGLENKALSAILNRAKAYIKIY